MCVKAVDNMGPDETIKTGFLYKQGGASRHMHAHTWYVHADACCVVVHAVAYTLQELLHTMTWSFLVWMTDYA